LKIRAQQHVAVSGTTSKGCSSCKDDCIIKVR